MHRWVTSLENKYKGKVEDVSFRDKRNGWREYVLSIRFDNGKEYVKLNFVQLQDIMKRLDYKVAEYVEPKKEEPKVQQPKVEVKEAPVVNGKVDAIVLTGGIAHSKDITADIAGRVGFIAPVEVYAGENELESLAENGYGILSEEFEIKEYSKL